MRVMIGRKYQLGNRIGRGEFGFVFHCWNIHTETECAVKIENADSGLLKREAQIYRVLTNVGGVPKLFDYGVEGPYRYLVMSFVRACSVAPSRDAIISAVPGLFRTLKDIHTAGITHGDIKPENIMFCGREAVIIDFGLSRYGAPPSIQLNSILGSAAYCSQRVSNQLYPIANDDIVSLVLTIANFVGDYTHPYDRKELGTAYLELLDSVQSMATEHDYTAVANGVLSIIRKEVKGKAVSLDIT